MVKFTNSNILSVFRKQMGISKAEEMAFAEAFQSTFEEALLRDKVLKISGLGTFKLIPVESRKSVNVNTGEEIEIAGHYKLTFTPDAVLKDKVNEPLAHLETIELADDVVENQQKNLLSAQYTEVSDDSQEVVSSQEDPLLKLAEQAAELKDILSDIKAIDLGLQPNEPILNARSEVDSIVNGENHQEGAVELEKDIEEKNIYSSTMNEDKRVVEQKAQTEKDQAETLVSAKDIVSEINNEDGYSQSSNSWIWITTAVILFLVIIGLLLYQNRDFFITQDSTQEQTEIVNIDTIKTEELIGLEEPISNDLPQEEVALDVEQVVEAEEIIEEAIGAIDETSLIYSDKFADIFNYKREYVEFIDTISLNGGKRLTLVSLEFYGHRDYWVYIYEANKDVIKHPNSIQIGTKLRIPKLAPELIDATNPETIEYARYLHDIYVKK